MSQESLMGIRETVLCLCFRGRVESKNNRYEPADGIVGC